MRHIRVVITVFGVYGIGYAAWTLNTGMPPYYMINLRDYFSYIVAFMNFASLIILSYVFTKISQWKTGRSEYWDLTHVPIEES